MVSCILSIQTFNSKHIVTQIGGAAPIPENLSQGMPSCLDSLLFLGNLRSRELFLALQLRENIELWQLHAVRLLGCLPCSKIFTSHICCLFTSIVITKLHCT
uniref:Uncharacterized protein n=1 Tax=Opuntia streptacantha TaxID=393608 RepID=A0A7C8YIP0_OPUST